MPREGNPTLVIRLEPHVLERLRELAGDDRPGRGGGVAHLLRTWVYEKLGLEPPTPYAPSISPRRLRKQRKANTEGGGK